MTLENAVRVKFNGNDKDYFFINEIKDLKRGDKLLVETKNGKEIVTYLDSRSLTLFDKGHPKKRTLQKL